MIGDEIKNARKAKNLTQKELAEMTGISRNAIVNYEKGYRVPTFENLLKLRATLGIDINKSREFKKEFFKTVNETLNEINSNTKTVRCQHHFFYSSSKAFEIANLLSDSNYRYVKTASDNGFAKLKIIDDTTGKQIELTDEDTEKLYNDTLQYFDFLLKKMLKQKQGD